MFHVKHYRFINIFKVILHFKEDDLFFVDNSENELK